MFVVTDDMNIVRDFCETAIYVKLQTNGVTIPVEDKYDSTAIFCTETGRFWATKPTKAGDKTFNLFETESVPEGGKIGTMRYANGVVSIDEELEKELEQEYSNSLEKIMSDLENKIVVLENKLKAITASK